MSSEVFICNLALTNLAKPEITSLTQASAEARACNRYYAHVRDILLQAYPWFFAGKTASLAALTNDKPGDWEYAYQVPTDCLKERYVRQEYVDEAEAQPDLPETTPYGFPYEIEGATLYCDLTPAILRYTYRLTDPTKFSPLFMEALSWHLAVRLAMPLTRDPKVRADAWQIAARMQATAEAADANRVRNTSNHDSEFVTERE